jgi:hypothetical protein
VRKIVIVSFFSFLFCPSFAQEKLISISSLGKQTAYSEAWTNLVSDSSFQIDYKLSKCDPEIGYDQELILLKIKNTSAQKATISWHAILYYNGVCKTCDYPEEYTFSVELSVNEEIEGICGIYEKSSLQIFSKFLDDRYTGGSRLSDFQLKNTTITPVNAAIFNKINN